MTIQEMRDVLKAYEEGKTIEAKWRTCTGFEWRAVPDPSWNFSAFDYRIKPESTYKPYECFLEINCDMWVKEKGGTTLERIELIDTKDQTVCIGSIWFNLTELFEHFEYSDGSPCGRKVKE